MREPRRSNRKGVKLLLVGIVLALVSYNISTSSSFIDEKSKGIASRTAKAKSQDSDDNIEKLKRFSKYYQTYRYLGPASRYDYVPVPGKECGESPDFGPWWNLDEMKRSSLGEDKFIYETFFKDYSYSGQNNFKGTYLELGAYNGIQESNTRFFDVCLGWKGLLIEGNPESYQKVLETRPYAHKMSLAPSCSAEYEVINKTIPFYRYPITNVGLVGHAKTYTGKPTVDVPCAPLQPILQDIFVDDENGNHHNGGLPTLDFFSLDVEGSEALVLSTIDFQAVRINILMIEIQNSHCKTDDCEVRKRVRAKMEAEGYIRYEGVVRNSDLYVHPKSPFQIPNETARPTWVPKN